MRHKLTAGERAVLEGPHRRGARRYYPPAITPRCIQLASGRLGERVAFRVKVDILHALHANRLKCPQSHVQSDVRDAHAMSANSVDDLRREMQARRWSRHRSALLRVDRLVALAVSLHIGTMNVRRQRDMPQPFELSEAIRHRLEPHGA